MTKPNNILILTSIPDVFMKKTFLACHSPFILNVSMNNCDCLVIKDAYGLSLSTSNGLTCPYR